MQNPQVLVHWKYNHTYTCARNTWYDLIRVPHASGRSRYSSNRRKLHCQTWMHAPHVQASRCGAPVNEHYPHALSRHWNRLLQRWQRGDRHWAPAGHGTAFGAVSRLPRFLWPHPEPQWMLMCKLSTRCAFFCPFPLEYHDEVSLYLLPSTCTVWFDGDVVGRSMMVVTPRLVLRTSLETA
jgi:hypothetical protein